MTLRGYTPRIALLAPALAVLAVALGLLRVGPPLVAFAVLGLSLVVGLAGVLVALLVILRGEPRRGLRWGLVAALPLLGAAVPLLASRGAPPINDVTTSLLDPPAFVAARDLPELAGEDLGYPADFVPVVREHYPDLAPLVTPRAPDEVYAAAYALAASRWHVHAGDAAGRRLEAWDESALFGFRDDVVVRVTAGAGGTVVDVRSRSRDGRGDLGVNARRIRGFLADLRERLGG